MNSLNVSTGIRFLVLNLILFIITSPVIILYGPFSNIKSSVIGAIMTSRHPQYITWLLSKQEIEAAIGDPNNSGQQKQNLFHFTKRQDESLKLVTIKGSRFQGYLLEVPDPSRIQVATARDMREKGETISAIGLENNAIAAINAGGFDDPDGTGTGRLPYGVVIHDGKFLIGGDINEKVPLVGFTRSGVLVAGNYTAAEMRRMQVTEGVTFGPPLIINGKKLIAKGDGGWGVGPRTAIGQRKDGTVLLLAIDGRQPSSLGATLLDVQNIMYEQGAYVAANLDGGSSTTMFYNGKVVNKPCDLLGERMLPTAFLVK
ncbi:phosphodiester glycosidase [Lucifera butyrica]|uniref:Phosphodiester glycosidase n=1 Tax=Lucifera butyrica TaxID=1351585 RepID=A0A498RFZ7_9FIRM|nr:phosphodiester glycosidase family protein [Lucifera butyrica]VBB09002.1 phosphodiester glycosidase [Lucifera butyrica]